MHGCWTTQVEVNGDRAHPIMKFLKMVDAADGSSQFANWNFNKWVPYAHAFNLLLSGIYDACRTLRTIWRTRYLVDRRGFPVKHYGSTFNSADLEAAIEEQLGKPEPQPAVSTASQ